MPTVSVIIPTYNRAHLIADAIQSVINQTFIDWEIVIVDDGSIDATKQVVFPFLTERIRYFPEEHKGPSATRNKGILEAKGEYITFLDADDIILPDKLKVQAKFLDERPDIGLVASGYYEVDCKNNIWREVHPWESSPDLDIKTWIVTCPVIVNAILVRRSWLIKVGLWDEDMLDGSEDWDIWLRLSYIGCKMEWLKLMVCYYRFHNSNMVLNARSMQLGLITVVDKLFKQQGLPKVITALKNNAYSSAYEIGAFRAYIAGNGDLGKNLLSKAVEYAPGLYDEPDHLMYSILYWASHPYNSSIGSFIDRVLDNLPDSLQCINPLRKKILYISLVRAVVDANLCNNKELARQHFERTYKEDINDLNNSSLMIDTLVDYVRYYHSENLEDIVDDFISVLPCGMQKKKYIKNKVMGKLYIGWLFQANKTSDFRKMRSYIIKGILFDPSWIKNRGIWSIGYKIFIGQKSN